jgi:hypothetical protein
VLQLQLSINDFARKHKKSSEITSQRKQLSKAIDKRKNKKTKTNGHVFVQKRMHE